MYLLTILSLVYFLSKINLLKDPLTDLNLPDSNGMISKMADDLPQLMADDSIEKRKTGQYNTEILAPFGPNPHQKHINDKTLVQSDLYSKKYQQNLRQTRIMEQDWRLENAFMINKDALNVLMPENNLPRIQQFSSTIPDYHQTTPSEISSNRFNYQ